MNIIMPITITAAMIQAGTSIAEPDPAVGETSWVANGNYVAGNQKVSLTAHKVYECVKAHSGRSTLPENDPEYWLAKRPSNRWQPFDKYITTAVSAVGSVTYVLSPGFFNAISLYGLVGASIAVTVKNAPGGAVMFSFSADLFEQATGLYELLFTPLLARTKLVLKDIPISPTAELTITVAAGPADPVGIGMINIGDFRPIIGGAAWGGTEYGGSAEPTSFSQIDFKADGTSEILPRGKATDIRGSVLMPSSAAAFAVATVQQVLDVPVSCIAIDAAGYDYMNTFGLISGSMVPQDRGTAKFSFYVKGFI